MAAAPKPLTTGQIATHCGVNYRTVIRWIERGELQAHRLPGRGDYRVQVQDFLAFLERHDIPIPKEFEAVSMSQQSEPRVLIVDDEPAMARSIARILRRARIETRIENNAFLAGQRLESFRPDVMTLDLQMPGLNGFAILEHLQKQQTSRPRILVISGMTNRSLAAALEGGADEVLPKPFTNHELLEKVQSLLNAQPTI